MKDKLKVEYDKKDGHKIVVHSRPLSKSQQARAKVKGVPLPEPEQRRRRTNYWLRHKNLMNMPVVFFLVILAVVILLIVLSIIG